MTDFNLAIEKITGSTLAGSACAVFNRRITLADLSVGTIVGCVLAKADDGSDVQIIIRDLLSLVSEKLERLEDSVLAGLVHIRDLSGEFLKGRKISVDFAYAFFWRDAAYIVRRGQKVGVQVFDPPKSSEIKFSEGSGPVAGGQIYVIATEKFFSLFDTAVFREEAEIEFGEIIDGLATEISAEPLQSEIGAVFVQVKGEKSDAAIAGDEVFEETEAVASETEKEVETEEKGQETGQGPPTFGAPPETASPEPTGVGAALPARFKNPLPIILSAVLREARRLRGGDMGAVGRLRKNIIVLALVILVVLVGSVSYAVYKNQEQKSAQELNSHLAAASTKLSEGTAIIGLNVTRAREIFIEADREADLAIAIDAKNDKAKSLKEEIARKLKETEETANISFETTFEAGEGLVSLSLAGANLIAVGGEKIFEVDPASRSQEEVVGASRTRAATVYDNKVFSMTDSRVVRVDVASEKSDELFTHAGASDIGVFLGNVYLLFGDKLDKYVPVESGYSGPSAYLSSPLQFSKSSHFAIDGLIWVSSGEGIFKFNRGERQDFEISGAPGGIGELGVIYTDSDLSNLYVVDMTNSALLVIGKDGTYKGSYQSPEFSRASDLVVPADEKKVYITVGTKVLEAALE